MKKLALCLPVAALMAIGCSAPKQEPALKDYFADDFLIGAALNVDHVKGLDPKADSIVRRHFNSIVAENCMKSEEIHPQEGVYFWDDADAFED